jgi:hypothetical protein
MKIIMPILLLWTVFSSASAQAVYRCISPAGEIGYTSARVCPDNTRREKVVLRENILDYTPASQYNQILAQENRQLMTKERRERYLREQQEEAIARAWR